MKAAEFLWWLRGFLKGLPPEATSKEVVETIGEMLDKVIADEPTQERIEKIIEKIIPDNPFPKDPYDPFGQNVVVMYGCITKPWDYTEWKKGINQITTTTTYNYPENTDKSKDESK